jgi:tetratricopeptide (TPR) repeat protein
MERAVTCDPQRHWYCLRLADMHVLVGNMDDARERYQRAAELAPDEGYYHYKLAEFYMRVREFPLAVSEYEQAVRCAPVDDFYCGRLGAAYVRQNGLDQARAALDRASRIAPANPIYRYALADLMLLDSDDHGAEQAYAAAGPLDEYYADCLRRWRGRAGIAALGDIGLLPAAFSEAEMVFEEDEERDRR